MPRPAYSVIGNLCEKDDAILDVGCGDGYLLSLLNKMGYYNLHGCDKFFQNTDENSPVKITKGSIDLCDGLFDMIMFHHSFEHIENPIETLKEVYVKLKQEGYCLISIPIADSRAFRQYGEYWVQLDAPRHIFIHSENSMEIISNKAGFNIDSIIYDSSAFQDIGSIQYMKGKDGKSRRSIMGLLYYVFFSIFKYSKQAFLDNNNRQADQATFILRKKQI